MKKVILKGEWSQGTKWEFILSKTLPADISITATCSIGHINNKIILTKTRRGWELPGGHLEEGESLSESLRREMEEETGVQVKQEVLFGYLHVHNTTQRQSKSTGKIYPEHSYIPHYFVGFDGAPGECSGNDAFESKAFDIFDPEIQNCNNYEIIHAAHTIYLSGNYINLS